MGILLPEVQLYNLVTGILNHVRVDYNAHLADPTKSLLYYFFGGKKVGKFDYFEQSKFLFLKGTDNIRQLEVRQMFDISRAALPTIHLGLPSLNAFGDGIGVDEGYQEPIFGETVIPPDPPDEPGHTEYWYQSVYTRSFQSTYNIIISSENPDEVLLIFNFLYGMLISVLDSVELAGFRNPKLGGQDLQLNSEVIPANVYIRAITLSAFYEVSVPRWFTNEMLNNILSNGLPEQVSEEREDSGHPIPEQDPPPGD